MGHKTALSQLHGTTVKPTALLIYPGWMQLWTWEKKTKQPTNHHSPKSSSRDQLSTTRKEFMTEGKIHSLLLDSTQWPQKAVPFAGPWLSTLPGLAPCRTAPQHAVSHHVRTCFHPGKTPASGTRRQVMGWGWKQLSSASSPGQNSCYKNIWANCWGF